MRTYTVGTPPGPIRSSIAIAPTNRLRSGRNTRTFPVYTGRKEPIYNKLSILIQKRHPIRPVFSPSIIKRWMSPSIPWKQHLRSRTDEHLHQIMIWRARGPTSVVHGGTTHVVPNAGAHTRLVEEEVYHFSEAPPAGRVEETLAKPIAGLHYFARVEFRLQRVHIVVLDCSDFVIVVCRLLVFC